MPRARRDEAPAWIARAFSATKDFVDIGLGFLLAASAVTLLARSVVDFWQGVAGGRVSTIELLDRIDGMHLMAAISSCCDEETPRLRPSPPE